jgi:hypothetical protein
MTAKKPKNRTTRMVRAIDTEATLPLVSAVYEAVYGEPIQPNSRVEAQVFIVGENETCGTDVANVCTEGVGLWQTDEATIEVWCVSPHGHRFTIPLGIGRVPLLDDPVDFAEFVRVFGARLESNWRMWDTFAAKAQHVPSWLTRFTVGD